MRRADYVWCYQLKRVYIINPVHDNVHVNVIGTEGKISRFAGAESKCNCLDRGCDCYEEDHYLAATAKFNTISSITVSPDGVVHVADQANYR